MIAEGCSDGSRLLPVSRQASGVARVSFSLSDLRQQRAATIWGDAFRRPFAYQRLCGLNGGLDGAPTSHSNSDDAMVC